MRMSHRNGVNIIHGILQNINPATGELLYPSISITTPSELSSILSKAKFAQRVWSDFPLSKRIELLRESLTTGIQPISQQLATTITNEMGKIFSESQLEVQQAIELKGKWLDMVQEANEDMVLVDEEDINNDDNTIAESVVLRDPLGVVAVLSPWNVSLIPDAFDISLGSILW